MSSNRDLTQCLHSNFFLCPISSFIRSVHFANQIPLLHLQLIKKKIYFLTIIRHPTTSWWEKTQTCLLTMKQSLSAPRCVSRGCCGLKPSLRYRPAWFASGCSTDEHMSNKTTHHPCSDAVCQWIHLHKFFTETWLALLVDWSNQNERDSIS